MATTTLGALLNLKPSQVAGMSLAALGAAVTAALALPELQKPENKTLKDALTVLSVALTAVGIAMTIYTTVQTLLPLVDKAKQAGAAVMNPAAIPVTVADTLKDIASPAVGLVVQTTVDGVRKILLEPPVNR